MKKHYYLGFVLMAFMTGCTEFEEPIVENLTNGETHLISERLSFNSYESFMNTIVEIGGNIEANPEEIIKRHIIKPENFISLRTVMNSENPSTINLRSMDSNESNDTELVPDPAFAELLNQNLEIEVDNVVFKINQYGTFFTPTENYDK